MHTKPRKMSFFLSAAWVVFSAVCVVLIASVGRGADDSNGPVHDALAQYSVSVAALDKEAMTSDEIAAWRRGWLNRLLAVARENPDSDRYRHALQKSLGLANSLENYSLSAEIIRKLLGTDGSPGQQAGLYEELGDVLVLESVAATSSSGEQPSLDRDAVAAASEAYERAERVAADEPNATARKVSSATKLARLRLRTGDPAGAAVAYERARQHFAAVPQEVRDRLLPGYAEEPLAASQRRAALAAQDFSLADSALEPLLERADRDNAAKTDFSNHRTPDLTGKAVIVEREGWHIGVRENVRFTTIGEDSFVIIPRPKSQTEQYDYWMPLEKVSGIKVFDKMEDAVAHDQRSSPSAQTDNGDAPEESEFDEVEVPRRTTQ